MCGIWGHNGKKYSFNKEKFNILGLYNEKRGKQSCGISLNGDIFLSSTNNHLYSEFIQYNNKIFDEKPSLVKSVIGHVRQASKGGISELNTHPFGFGKLLINDTPIFKFIGIHNGTIYNEYSLAKTYNIEEFKEVKSNSKNITKHQKIDSEILLEILYSSDNYNVLSQYYGSSALAWIDTNKPDSLFLFHGESDTSKFAKNKTEERPLFIWLENTNSLYFSSLEEALYAIGGNDETIFELPHNIVFEIKNGNFKKAIQHKINRSNAGQYRDYKNNTYSRYDSKSSYYGYNHYENYYAPKKINNNSNESKTKKHNNDKKIVSIFLESPIKKLESPIIYNKLRYKKNGHNVNGIYFPTMDGLLFMGNTIKEATSFFNNKYRLFYSFKEDTWLKFKKNNSYNIVITSTKLDYNMILFIYDGILLRTLNDYEAVISLYKNYLTLPLKNIIEASKYPVAKNVNSKKQGKKIKHSSEVLYSEDEKEHSIFSGEFKPLGSNKTYFFDNGKLIKTTEVGYSKVIFEKPVVKKTSSIITLPAMNTSQSSNNFKVIKKDVIETNNTENFKDELNEICKILTITTLSSKKHVNTLFKNKKNEELYTEFEVILDDIETGIEEFIKEYLN